MKKMSQKVTNQLGKITNFCKNVTKNWKLLKKPTKSDKLVKSFY